VEATSAPQPRALRIPKPRRLLAALSDERLVEHIRKGDEAAFEVLYDRYSGGILGFCRHMLGNVPDAEDAAQHTFIAAHADVHRHDRRDLHVKAWLYTIARNRCVSMLRARRELPSEETADVATDDLVHDVERREELRALLADVTKLPEDQREALVLSEVGDLSHSEISQVLGCEVAKVKSLVFQARTALIDRRIARETPCEEIREQLATLHGGALRRSSLRHHLEACPGCTQYREEIRRQRALLGLALPVLPSAALKAKVLGGIGLGGSTAAAGGGAAVTATSGLSLAAPSGIAKLGVVVALAAGGAGTATVASHGDIPLLHHTTPAVQQTPAGTHSKPVGASGAAHTGSTASATAPNGLAKGQHKTQGSRRSASGTEHGFTPITGESNGERARAFAQTRGKGQEMSAANRHSTAKTRSKRAKRVHVKHVAAPPKKGQAKVAPVHTQPVPAPKTDETTTTTPTSTVTTPTTTTPTRTTPQPQQTPPPSGESGSTTGAAGKSLGSGKQNVSSG
jgi:RNA polymerase sigma factor (sigma-70 family)